MNPEATQTQTPPLQDLFERVKTPQAGRPEVTVADAMFQLVAMLAAPRLLAGEIVTEPILAWMREGLWRRIIDRYLGVLARMRGSGDTDLRLFLRTEEPTRRAKRLLETWPFSRTAPEPVVRAARDFFEAFGWSESEHNWDLIEGPLGRGMDPSLLERSETQVRSLAHIGAAELAGASFACTGDSAVLFVIADTERLYLPCFTTEERLRTFFRKLDMAFDTVHRIDDPEEFAESLRHGSASTACGILVDPHLIPGPEMRWAEIKGDFAFPPDFGAIHVIAFPG